MQVQLLNEHTDPAQVLDKGRKSRTKEERKVQNIMKLKLKPQFT
jgi:hypothetical protein